MTNVVVVSLVLNSFLRWQWWPSIGGCQGGIGRWGWRPPEAPPSSTVPPSTSPSTECHLNDQVPRYCCWSFAIHFCCCHCCCWWITGPRTLWAPVAKQASRWERLWRERRLWSHHTWATLQHCLRLNFLAKKCWMFCERFTWDRAESRSQVFVDRSNDYFPFLCKCYGCLAQIDQ